MRVWGQRVDALAPSCEVTYQDLTDARVVRVRTRELDEFLGASSAGELPKRIKTVAARGSVDVG
jgi:hypothetical protein